MNKNVAIIGGTGLIGQTIFKMISDRNPNVKCFIGTRKVKEENHIYINVEVSETFNNLKLQNIDLVVVCTRDYNNSILNFAITNKVDYIDVTRPTPELISTLNSINKSQISSKIIFSSGWMGGIVPILINHQISKVSNVKEIKIITFYSTKDKAGKSSADFMAENVNKYFNYYRNNLPVKTKHFLRDENYSFKYDNKTRKIFDFDIPDLYLLNNIEKIPNVSAKLSFNTQFINYALSIMQKTRIFKILNKYERKLIFGGSGKGDTTFFEIIIKNHENEENIIGLKSLNGQSELTAFSTVLHIEKILENVHPSGIYFGHNIHSPHDFIKNLTTNSSIILY